MVSLSHPLAFLSSSSAQLACTRRRFSMKSIWRQPEGGRFCQVSRKTLEQQLKCRQPSTRREWLIRILAVELVEAVEAIEAEDATEPREAREVREVREARDTREAREAIEAIEAIAAIEATEVVEGGGGAYGSAESREDEEFEAELAKLARKVIIGSGEKEKPRYLRERDEGVFAVSNAIRTETRLNPPTILQEPAPGGKVVPSSVTPDIERFHGKLEALKLNPVALSSDLNHMSLFDQKVFFLESYGVDTLGILSMCPSILNLRFEKLKGVIDFLEFCCGLKRREVGRVVSIAPQILCLGLTTNLWPAVHFLLKEVGLSRAQLRKAINCCPLLLVVSVDTQLRPTMHYLEDLGYTRIASLVSYNARILTFSIKTKFLPKLEFLQDSGLSSNDAVSMVLRFPAILNYSVKQNLMPKFDYLVSVMGRDLKELQGFPQYFGFSLAIRIRPRHEYLVQRNIALSLPNILIPTDKQFYYQFGEVQVVQVSQVLQGHVEKNAWENLVQVGEFEGFHRNSKRIPICLK